MEPFTVGALGALTATEGIKFLYGQAGEILSRWRERRAGRAAASTVDVAESDAAVVDGRPTSLVIDFDAVDRLHEDIADLADALGGYAGGLRDAPAGDERVAQVADALRRLLEVVYGRPLTLAGEDRRESGPDVRGRVDVERVAGDVAGVRARLIRKGKIVGLVRADDVTGTGTASGVAVDKIG